MADIKTKIVRIVDDSEDAESNSVASKQLEEVAQRKWLLLKQSLTCFWSLRISQD